MAEGCPGACESSCIECLQTFRNSFYHNRLDRKVVMDALKEWGRRLTPRHEIPPIPPDTSPSGDVVPVNLAERKLRHLLLSAGFGEGTRNEQIRLGSALGTTSPDVIYRNPEDDFCKGVCIYLDGMSTHIHGNPATGSKDRAIRTWLRGSDYKVIEIPANELDDEDAMARHFQRLANYLGLRRMGRKLAKDRSWFSDPSPTDGLGRVPQLPILRLVVRPTPTNRFRTCVPLVPLRAAASDFGDCRESLTEEDREWVEFDGERMPHEGMFVAQVVGKSMEPRIPDGSYCLFSSQVPGSRQGRTLLVKMRDETDPETSERFTMMQYWSRKKEDQNGWRHLEITLEPLNPDFGPIVIAADGEAEVKIPAEMIGVLGTKLGGQ